MKISERLKKILFYNNFNLVLFFITVLVFHFCYGLHIINPTNTNWLMSAYHDWGQHYLGWAYFRDESWNFPLGEIENYNYPAGTNIGLTDSIPILAIFFKLFSFILPDDFQYFGIWLFLCFFLNGVYSLKILKLYFKESNVILLLSVAFIIANPILIYRGMHPALCGHWLLLASLYGYLKKSNHLNVYTINKAQIALLVLSALVTPYLFLMVIGFNFIIPFKHFYYDKTIDLKKAILFPFFAIISVLIIWFLIGMITFNDDKGLEVIDSYGLYGFNLNNFYNPSGYSKFLKQLDWTNPHQYEGFSYLGIGFILLLITTITIICFNFKTLKYTKKLTPLIFLTGLYTCFAITNKVSLGSEIILEYPTLEIIKRVGNIFRASGRFIWVFYYVLYLFTLILFIKSKKSSIFKAILLSLLFLLQVYDISLLITFRDLPNGNYKIEKFDKEWFTIVSNFEKIITYPPFQYDLLNTMDYQDLCYLALKNNIPITCGYVARESGNTNLNFKDKLSEDLSEGTFSDNSLYITTSKYVEDFYPSLHKNNLELRYLNGYYLIYKGNIKRQFIKKPLEIKKQDSIYHKISKEKVVEINTPKVVQNSIKYHIEEFNDSGTIRLKGWAFLNTSKNNSKDSIFIVLSSKDKTFLSKVKQEIRTDVSQEYGENLDNSGFRATIFENDIQKGLYSLYIGIKNEKSNIIFEKINPKIQVSVKIFKKIETIDKLPNLNPNAKGNLDRVQISDNKLKVRGWSIIPKSKNKIFYKIILSNSETNYVLETNPEVRTDITTSFDDGFNYDNSGFDLSINTNMIKKGDYKIFVLFEGKERMIFNPKKIIKID